MQGTRTDTLAARVRDKGAPLIDGDTATFVWLGEEPPRLIGDFNGFGWREPTLPLTESEPGVWTHALKLSTDAYIEYAYTQGGERFPDPLNTRRITNGAAGMHSFFAMPDAEETPLARVSRAVPRGTITRHSIENGYLIVGGKRTVRLYRPPVDEPCPLLVVFDGQDYLPRARLATIVDNLIAQRRIRPIAMALINHGNKARFMEYNCSEATLGFLLRAVLPLAREHLDLLDADGAHGTLGASMGGLMSLYTAVRVPRIFGHVISQSGAFGFEQDSSPPLIQDLVRSAPARPLDIWMDAGSHEALIEPNRQMFALLQQKGYNVSLREYPGGHNFTSWKNDVWRGLEAVFGR